jgi:hypothetical protein
VSNLVRSLALRLEGLWAALALIWRGGPVVFGCTALAYAVWSWVEQVGSRGLLQLVGAHDTAFWSAFLPLLLVAVAAVAEPLRVAIVATAFDTVVGRPEARMGTRESGFDAEARDLVGAGDVERERPLGIIGEQEHRQDGVGA